MLSFTERLKDIIYEVEQTGGDPLERLLPLPHFVQQLKAYALKTIEEIPSVQTHRVSGFLLEEFNEGFFDEGIRVSIIFLNRIGITANKQIEQILKTVIKRRILNRFAPVNDRHFDEDQENIEDALVMSVAEIWENGGAEITRAYTFAKQRALISWDYRENHWKVTNLGRFFLELNAFRQFVSFLRLISV